MKMPLLLISPKIGLKFLLIAKGGCFECYAVIGNKTEYYCVYIERLFAPFKGWVSALFSFPDISEKYWGLSLFWEGAVTTSISMLNEPMRPVASTKTTSMTFRSVWIRSGMPQRKCWFTCPVFLNLRLERSCGFACSFYIGVDIIADINFPMYNILRRKINY